MILDSFVFFSFVFWIVENRITIIFDAPLLLSTIFINSMEKFYISEKNIPIPSKKQYKIHLILKVEKFMKRMRRKVLQFLGKLESTNKETFGFRSRKCPPAVEELTNFENDVMLMIKNIQFRHINSTFQEQLKKDIQEVRQSNQLFVSADKSRNIYKMNKEDYEKLIHESITKTYKKQLTLKSKQLTNPLKRLQID